MPKAIDLNAVHEKKMWMIDQITKMNKFFAPYLGFSHIK
jgi:hypothetical protein